MNLSNLTKLKGNRKSKKRVGRGMGSGKGSHTTGRGQKGQKSRSGHNIPFGFEGGQVPLFRKMPKLKGFTSSHRTTRAIINLTKLDDLKNDDKVTPETLVKKGILKEVPKDGVKILGDGDFSKKLDLSGFVYSKEAKAKIEKLGGKAA